MVNPSHEGGLVMFDKYIYNRAARVSVLQGPGETSTNRYIFDTPLDAND